MKCTRRASRVEMNFGRTFFFFFFLSFEMESKSVFFFGVYAFLRKNKVLLVVYTPGLFF